MSTPATPTKRRQRWHLWTIRGVPSYFDSKRHRRALRYPGWTDYVYTGQSVLAVDQPRVS